MHLQGVYMIKITTCIALTLIAYLLLPTTEAKADVVDRALVHHASNIAKAIQEHLKDSQGEPVEYIAVLKFEVQVGNQPASFDVGLANAQLAQKLENLLVLTYDANAPAVLTGAAAKAAKKLPPTVTWKDKSGRKQLATLSGLPLAWDQSQSLTPDAFVTGTLQLAEDLQSAEIVLYGFTRENPADLKTLYSTPQPIDGKPVAIPTDRSLLAMIGATFCAVDNNLDRISGDRKAIADVIANLRQPSDFEQRLASSPVQLEILLNNEVVKLETDSFNPHAGRIASGINFRRGDSVKFQLRNTDPNHSYAVLLAVNGKNTNALSNDHLNAKPPKDHRLWVLAPKETVIITGFYTSKTGEVQPFKILGDSESEAVYPLLSENYRGLITMHVFRDRKEIAEKPDDLNLPPKVAANEPQSKPPEAIQVEAEVTLLSLGVGGDALEEVRTAGSPEKAKQKIQSLTNVSVTPNGELSLNPLKFTTSLDRGLIVGSETRKNGGPIESVKFALDPYFIGFLQIRYYGQ
jgi:hypothetical protein